MPDRGGAARQALLLELGCFVVLLLLLLLQLLLLQLLLLELLLL